VIAIRLSVNDAFTRDRDVPLTKGINESRVTHQLHAFPAREDHRQVFHRIAIKSNRRVLTDMQIDIALEVNGAGDKLSLGHQHPAATCPAARGNSFGEGLSTIGAGISDSAESGNGKISSRKDWRFDAAKDSPGFNPGVLNRQRLKSHGG
jgi:hypothetical protein